MSNNTSIGNLTTKSLIDVNENYFIVVEENDIDNFKINLKNILNKIDNKISETQKGSANGVVPLNSSVRIDSQYLPFSVVEYKGTWDASTNSPTLEDGTGRQGDAWVSNSVGTVDFGSGDITFREGDWAIYNGSIWEKSTNSNAVASVNGETGVVDLTAEDIDFTNEESVSNALIRIRNANPSSGFVDRTEVAITELVGADRNFTITGTDFTVYVKGNKFIKNTQTITLADVTGMHYIFYNDAGELQHSMNSADWKFSEIATVAMVYYNTTLNEGLVWMELHGHLMDADTHRRLHLTDGTRYEKGLAGTYNNTTFSIDEGVIHDEDIRFPISTQTQTRVLYRDGTDFKWTPKGTIYYYTDGGNIHYDNAGTITPVGNNNFVAYWAFATNIPSCPVIHIMGQREDNVIAGARNNNGYETLNFGDLLIPEKKVLYRIILKNDGTPYEETLDLRTVSELPSGNFVATQHNSLAGRSEANSHPATAISYGETNVGAELGTKITATPDTIKLKEASETVVDLGDVSTDTDFDLSSGSVFDLRVTDNVSFGFANATAGSFIKINIKDAGNHTINWGNVRWVGGETPTFTETGVDIIEGFTLDGVTWELKVEFARFEGDMTLLVDTELSSGTEVTMPLYGTVDATVDWGDGTTDSYTTAGDKSHTYADEGIYTVSITGTVTQFGNGANNYANADKIWKTLGWGNNGTTSLYGAFRNAINLIEVPDYLPSNVTNMGHMFREATAFNQLLPWDTGNVTNMAVMFFDATSFNQPLDWNTGNVTNMSNMFNGATIFNQPLPWDTANVTNMSYMFNGATAFNQLLPWDTGNVTNMGHMFFHASSFNQLLDWDTGNVTNMGHMFRNASSFNQPLNWDTGNVTAMNWMFFRATSFNQLLDWDTGNVTNMDTMFYGATAFNKPLDWNTANVTTMANMFREATAFNQLLPWDTGNVTNMGHMFFHASSFNQLLDWDTGNVTNMGHMFNGATIFNQDISMWDVDLVTTYTDFRLNSALIDDHTPPKFVAGGE